jgi:tripartite-type tricarboxylate transporter receptor subunit TctC
MTQISGLMLGLSALLIVESPAAQTNYPQKPIRLVVGFPIGGEADTVARLLGQKLTGHWKGRSWSTTRPAQRAP